MLRETSQQLTHCWPLPHPSTLPLLKQRNTHHQPPLETVVRQPLHPQSTANHPVVNQKKVQDVQLTICHHWKCRTWFPLLTSRHNSHETRTGARHTLQNAPLRVSRARPWPTLGPACDPCPVTHSCLVSPHWHISTIPFDHHHHRLEWLAD